MPNCGFVFPTGSLSLVNHNTVMYISDNVLYKIDLASWNTEIFRNPTGRSFQAMAYAHKRSLLCLVDYGKNPTFFFENKIDSAASFQMTGVTQLEVEAVQLSLDTRYLAVVCGAPDYQLLIIDVHRRKVFKGPDASIKLPKNSHVVRAVAFNPAESSVLALMLEKQIVLYDLAESFEISQANLEPNLSIRERHVIEVQHALECLCWDNLSNLYYSDGNRLVVYSPETKKELISYDLEPETEEKRVIASLLLTRRHIIAFYTEGRIEWLNRYTPDGMEEEDPRERPFYLDKFSRLPRRIKQALYNNDFSNILIAHHEGSFSVVKKLAQSKENDDEQETAVKGADLADKKLELDVSSFGPFHTDVVMEIVQVPNTSCFISVARNGRVIMWSVKLKRSIALFETHVTVQSASFNSNCSVLALGLSDGVVQFYAISDLAKSYLFKEFRLTRGSSIKLLQFSSNGDQLAVVDQSTRRVFFLLTKIGADVEIIGYTTLQFAITSMDWCRTNKNVMKPLSENLLLCVGSGLILINSPASVPTRKRGKQLQLNCQIFACRIEQDSELAVVLPEGQILVTARDRRIRKYKQPEMPFSKIDWKVSAPVTAPVEEYEAHNLSICLLKAYQDRIITASEDGTVQFRRHNDMKTYEEFKVYGWRQTCISSASAAREERTIYVGGKDGSVYVFNGSQAGLQEPKPVSLPDRPCTPLGAALKFYEETLQQEYLSRMKDVIVGKKKAQLDRLNKIKVELKQLLVENEAHQDLEKLDRDEFVIDLEFKDKASKVGQERCLKIREESKRKILENQVYTKKLKQITWDRMTQQLQAINGLRQNFIVYNYQIRKVGAEQDRQLELVLDMRRMQKRQQRKKAAQYAVDPQYYRHKSLVNSGIVQPLILTEEEIKEERKEEKGKKKKEEEVVAVLPDPGEQIFFEEQWNMLYTSFELYSPQAKTNQIVMMRNIIMRIKEVFNKEFEQAMKHRQQQNELINDKNKRIAEICAQLKRDSQMLISKPNFKESIEGILIVHQNEIPFKRYLSKEERDRLEKERLKEEERMRKLAEDDSSQRALQKMMGGTLEEKKTSLLEVTVERQKWMDKPQEDMNEDEKVKMKEYETKRVKAEEEKERVVKKLEAELRKLKQEIEQIMDKFDERVFYVLKRRIEYDYRISEQELYCAQLALSIYNIKDKSDQKQSIQTKINQLKNQKAELQQKEESLKQIQQEIEHKKEQKRLTLDAKKLGEMESKIKSIEKSTFEDFNTNPKKRRELEEKLLQFDVHACNLIVKLDPMREIESRLLSVEKSKDFSFFLKLAHQPVEGSEGALVQILESRFRTRQEENDLEHRVQILQRIISEQQKEVEECRIHEEGAQGRYRQLEDEMAQDKSDLSVLCRLKQGQVQITNSKPVPELKDALLIARNQIELRNKAIIENAQKKIEVMKEIKKCKIDVTESTLNLAKKQEHIMKLSMEIKQIQMLKVKKEMQLALAKKDTRMNDVELKSLKDQVEKVRKEGDKRVLLYEKKIEKIINQIEAIRKENKQLEAQKWNKHNTVMQREKIKDMMTSENGDSAEDTTEKFERIAINRKLFDQAKRQTEEIELLREELAKLKAKTFANFSNVQR